MMKHRHFSQAIEDYLKVVYELCEFSGRASTSQIARRMNVSAASATNMMQKMADIQPPLVVYQKHRGVSLTEEGRNAALEILRHHRLLELFLQSKLGYGWDEVHSEADQLEHYLSEELEEHISQALGNPTHDPHGAPIPSREYQLPERTAVELAELRPGQRAVVQWVDDADAKLLRYLERVGLLPQTSLRIMGYSEFDGNLSVCVEGEEKELVLGPGIARKVHVAIKPTN